MFAAPLKQRISGDLSLRRLICKTKADSFPSEIKDEKKPNNSHKDKSDHFHTEIESNISDLDGPELLQFAMILVKGALKNSQVCDYYKSLLKLSFLVEEAACAS